MTTVPYQPKVFCAFIAAVGRLFYDDAVIVLLDFLAKEQRAFSEAEIKEVLNWRESLLMQQLAKLEQQLLVEKIIEAERGSRTIYLWRLHPQVCLAVGWRLKVLMEQLQADVDNASQQSALVCPECNMSVSLLDAACGPKALEDDHPLCKNCSVKLTTCNSEQARQQAEDRFARAHKSLSYLQEFVTRVNGMEVPSFTSEKFQAPDATTASGERLSNSGQSSNEPVNNAASSTPASADTKLETPNDNTRAIPWFMNSAQPTSSGQPEVKANTGETTSSVSFGRSQSKTSVLTATSVAMNASSVLGGTSGTIGPSLINASLSMGQSLSRPPPLGTTTTPVSTTTPSGGVGGGGFSGISLAPPRPLISMSNTTASKPGSKPFSLSLKLGPKSDLSDGSGRASKILKRPADSSLSKAFDKKVRF